MLLLSRGIDAVLFAQCAGPAPWPLFVAFDLACLAVYTPRARLLVWPLCMVWPVIDISRGRGLARY